MKALRKTLKLMIITFILILFLIPIMLTVINSFIGTKELQELYYNNANKVTLSFIPTKITIVQYYTLLIEKFKYLKMFWNSVLISTSITFLHTIVAIISAYVFAKVKFKGRDKLFIVYIIVMMMPYQVLLLPNYIQARFFNIYDTYWSIILPGVFAPFGVFLLRQYMKYIPDELIEAVALDSSSIFQVIFHVVIPYIKPGIIALMVLTFTEAWNMVEQPLVMLENELKYPLSVAFNSIINEGKDVAFAGSVLFIIPIIILFLFFEEHIVEGLQKTKY